MYLRSIISVCKSLSICLNVMFIAFVIAINIVRCKVLFFFLLLLITSYKNIIVFFEKITL